VTRETQWRVVSGKWTAELSETLPRREEVQLTGMRSQGKHIHG
jgi:hypothetical protein